MCCVLSCSVMSKSLRLHGLLATSVPVDSPGKNTGVSCHALLQGIFTSQGSNPGLPHCTQILYHLSHQGSPKPDILLFSFLESFQGYQNWRYSSISNFFSKVVKLKYQGDQNCSPPKQLNHLPEICGNLRIPIQLGRLYYVGNEKQTETIYFAQAFRGHLA